MGDDARAKPLFAERGLKGACLMADQAAMKAWQLELGAFYLVGKDGRFAAPVLRDLPTAGQLKAAGIE